ncbi:hypothetical protein NP233_g9429 [Leucocoprinus birnbaumii]|uniref:AA9 family lytic polysaccharide monooxygenase n=1 Tax=Leucocoprinus birnbaumii TaxID=56174 RepID=A0AAD5VKG7_9AGAR|nr:hypothetical protein NP233_g9429 [Leucocoprinus birnbaumii]
MKIISLLSLVAIAQTASAHYIWNTLIAGSTTSSAAVRQPVSNSPVESVTSNNVRCNANPSPASAVVDVAPGATVGFKLDNTLYHTGPATIYLGKAPGSVSSWDGSGSNWFKIAEWGATYNPFKFTDDGQSQLTTTIPANTPPGEYLIRIEQIALHVAGAPQWYISCAQIRVTGNGSGNPPKVSIPGHVSASDPGLTVNIYYPVPTSYTASIWSGADVENHRAEDEEHQMPFFPAFHRPSPSAASFTVPGFYHKLTMIPIIASIVLRSMPLPQTMFVDYHPLLLSVLALVWSAQSAVIDSRAPQYPNCNTSICSPNPLPCPFPGASEEISTGCWTCCTP